MPVVNNGGLLPDRKNRSDETCIQMKAIPKSTARLEKIWGLIPGPQNASKAHPLFRMMKPTLCFLSDDHGGVVGGDEGGHMCVAREGCLLVAFIRSERF